MDYECNSNLYTKIVELYQQGYSCKDIAAACDLSPLHVRNYLRDVGFETQKYRKISENNRDKVLLLIRNNYSYSQIEKLLHVSSHAIREIVENNGLIGFAPRYHHPIVLEIEEGAVPADKIAELRLVYTSGKFGLALCAKLLDISDEAFLWFVYHLTEEDIQEHHGRVVGCIREMAEQNVPVTAIAKGMDISPAIVKRILRELR